MASNLSWGIGAVTVTRVEERIASVPWQGLVPDGAQHVDACRPWIDPYMSDDGSELELSVHSFIVETPEHVMVVDTCVGDTDQFSLPGDGEFGDRLAAALPGGLEGVDIVVCTHLHFDHVGWNAVEVDGVRVPRFPNARYLATATEIGSERDEEDTASYARSIEPLAAAGVLDAVAMDHQVDQWVSLEPAPGHTPGHVVVRIADGNDTAIITGDFIHTPLQFAHPEAASRPDFDPAQATETRRRYVAELANTDTLVLGTHFGPPTAGYIKDDGAISFS